MIAMTTSSSINVKPRLPERPRPSSPPSATRADGPPVLAAVAFKAFGDQFDEFLWQLVVGHRYHPHKLRTAVILPYN